MAKKDSIIGPSRCTLTEMCTMYGLKLEDYTSTSYHASDYMAQQLDMAQMCKGAILKIRNMAEPDGVQYLANFNIQFVSPNPSVLMYFASAEGLKRKSE